MCAPADLPSLGTETLLAFVEAGGNVVAAASEESTSAAWALEDFLEECGIQLSQEGRRVIDHVNPADPAGDHTTILTTDLIDSPYVVGNAKALGPVVFKGVSQSFSADNYLALGVLRASDTAYVANPKKPVPASATVGSDIVLVSAVQARNNARLLFFGSLWMLSDEAFDAKTPAGKPVSNAAFAIAATKWALQESGVLRASVRSGGREGGMCVLCGSSPAPLVCAGWPSLRVVFLCVCVYVCSWVCLCVPFACACLFLCPPTERAPPAGGRHRPRPHALLQAAAQPARLHVP